MNTTCRIQNRRGLPRHAVRLALALGVLGAHATLADVYEVGEGQPYVSIGSVPWESLLPGDTVLIH